MNLTEIRSIDLNVPPTGRREGEWWWYGRGTLTEGLCRATVAEYLVREAITL